MMEKYFTDGFIIKRYVEGNGGWSDGEGTWEPINTVGGYIRTLGATERTDINDLQSTHRFYTKETDIKYGDRIEKDNTYEVKLVDIKNLGNMAFTQVDCELIQP